MNKKLLSLVLPLLAVGLVSAALVISWGMTQVNMSVSEPITVANDINLLFSADAGEGIEMNSISMTLEGVDGATSIVSSTAMRTGYGVDTLDGRVEMLEDGSGKIINETAGTDGFAPEA